jgi:hypothetical protein
MSMGQICPKPAHMALCTAKPRHVRHPSMVSTTQNRTLPLCMCS